MKKLLLIAVLIFIVSCTQAEVPSLPSQIAGPIGKAINIYPSWALKDEGQLFISKNVAAPGEKLIVKASNSFILKSFYTLEGGVWKKNDFSCSSAKEDWCIDNAEKEITISSTGETHFIAIAYMCDSLTSCNNEKWLMQIVNIMDTNKPDLEITSIDVIPKTEKQPSTFNIKVVNNGNTAVNKFHLKVQGITRASDSMQNPEEEINQPITAQMQKTITLTNYTKFPLRGEYLITATVDSQNIIDEYDEQNNQFAQKITIN